MVVSDDDYTFESALNSFPESKVIRHILCTYHLFDMNVKRHLSGILEIRVGDAKWKCFRESLSLCRKATSQEDLYRLWDELLDKCLDAKVDEHRKARNYLNKHVWSKRERWAVWYFKNSFTLEASTTQRSDSWNALVKSCSKTTNLCAFFESLKFLFNRQGLVEERMTSSSYCLSPGIISKAKIPKSVLNFLKTERDICFLLSASS